MWPPSSVPLSAPSDLGLRPQGHNDGALFETARESDERATDDRPTARRRAAAVDVPSIHQKTACHRCQPPTCPSRCDAVRCHWRALATLPERPPPIVWPVMLPCWLVARRGLLLVLFSIFSSLKPAESDGARNEKRRLVTRWDWGRNTKSEPLQPTTPCFCVSTTSILQARNSLCRQRPTRFCR